MKTSLKRLLVIGTASTAVWAAADPGAARTDATKAPPSPAFTADGKLLPPSDYREWIYLSTGLDMNYSEKAREAGHSMFDNVFVSPAAYRVFRDTGTWPDDTQFALEVRGAASRGSINRHGQFQSGAPMALELHVKDSNRFKGGWAFFSIDGDAPAAEIAHTANCYSCHVDHAAVDTTFVQFYPTLLPIATAKQTLSASYLRDETQLKAASETSAAP